MFEKRTAAADSRYNIAACNHRVEALYHGHIIADSAQARVLREPGLPDIYFFPADDVSTEFLVQSDRTADVPGKGRAVYYRVFRDGRFAENGVVRFDDPAPEAADLRGMLGFDPTTVDIHVVESEDRWMDREADKMSEYIRHTDSGSGVSQAAPWRANVDQPDDESGETEDRTRP